MLISYSCSMSSLIPSVEETVSSTVHSMGSIERKCFGVPVKLRGGQKLGKKLRRDTLGTPKCPSPPPPPPIHYTEFNQKSYTTTEMRENTRIQRKNFSLSLCFAYKLSEIRFLEHPIPNSSPTLGALVGCVWGGGQLVTCPDLQM